MKGIGVYVERNNPFTPIAIIPFIEKSYPHEVKRLSVHKRDGSFCVFKSKKEANRLAVCLLFRNFAGMIAMW